MKYTQCEYVMVAHVTFPKKFMLSYNGIKSKLTAINLYRAALSDHLHGTYDLARLST